jgi:hypothetical protein
MGDSNPLQLAFKWFSVFIGIISVASVFDDFVAWRSFIERLVAGYQSLVYPPFRFLFSWLPFRVPEIVYDYFVFGFLVAASHLRTMSSLHEMRGYSSRIIPWDYEASDAVFRIVFWPTYVTTYVHRWLSQGAFDAGRAKENWLKHFTKNPPKNGSDTVEQWVHRMVNYDRVGHAEPIKFFQWLGATLVGFVGLLILNGLL